MISVIMMTFVGVIYITGILAGAMLIDVARTDEGYNAFVLGIGVLIILEALQPMVNIILQELVK